MITLTFADEGRKRTGKAARVILCSLSANLLEGFVQPAFDGRCPSTSLQRIKELKKFHGPIWISAQAIASPKLVRATLGRRRKPPNEGATQEVRYFRNCGGPWAGSFCWNQFTLHCRLLRSALDKTRRRRPLLNNRVISVQGSSRSCRRLLRFPYPLFLISFL